MHKINGGYIFNNLLAFRIHNNDAENIANKLDIEDTIYRYITSLGRRSGTFIPREVMSIRFILRFDWFFCFNIIRVNVFLAIGYSLFNGSKMKL